MNCNIASAARTTSQHRISIRLWPSWPWMGDGATASVDLVQATLLRAHQWALFLPCALSDSRGVVCLPTLPHIQLWWYRWARHLSTTGIHPPLFDPPFSKVLFCWFSSYFSFTSMSLIGSSTAINCILHHNAIPWSLLPLLLPYSWRVWPSSGGTSSPPHLSQSSHQHNCHLPLASMMSL